MDMVKIVCEQNAIDNFDLIGADSLNQTNI